MSAQAAVPLALREGSLLHFVLPSTLPLTTAATRDDIGTQSKALRSTAVSHSLDADMGDDPEADPSNKFRAKMAALPAGVLGKVRAWFVHAPIVRPQR